MNHSSKRHVTQEMNQCCVCTSHAAYQRIHFKVYLLITCFNVSINVEPISHFPHKNVKKKEKKKKDDLRLLRFWVVRVVPNTLEDSPKLFCGFRLSRHDSLNPCNPKLTWDVEIRRVEAIPCAGRCCWWRQIFVTLSARLRLPCCRMNLGPIWRLTSDSQG